MFLRAIGRQLPATLAVGPGQWGYLFQGHDNRPVRVDLNDAKWVDMGVDPPVDGPIIDSIPLPVKYYVARIDVVEGGVGYNKAPLITLDPGSEPPEREAKARAYLDSSALGSVDVTDHGRGYKNTPLVTLTDTHGKNAAITIKLGDTPVGSNTPTPQTADSKYYYPIESAEFDSEGDGYTVSPEVRLNSDTGGGGLITVKAKPDGKLGDISVDVGGSYTKPPKATVVSGGASANAIMRAHIRGKYDCYYRFLDDTPEDRGGPLPSSLSPVTTFDAGDGVNALTWSVAGAGGGVSPRAKKVELWRTTSDQAYTVYRVATLGGTGGSFEDDLTDVELTDYERPGYAAMPILLPNGELNANRFGVPPVNKSVGVMFQDRLWMAVDTSGSEPNVLRFSEYNEPESCPDVNELVLQTNVRGHDHITALIPYGASLGIMQTRHAHRLSYASQPLIDANIQIAAYRGCLNQRCWDEYQGVVYCMDTEGVYAMDQSGGVQPISPALDALFRDGIDFSKSEWFSVVADRHAKCLRVSVRLVGDGDGEYPTRQYCYSFDFQGWWEERYPSPLVGGATMRDETGVARCVYGTSKQDIMVLNSGPMDRADGTIISASLTNPGEGYVRPPKVRVDGSGVGAVIETAVGTDGRLLGLYVRCGGYGYDGMTTITIEPPPNGETAEGSCAIQSGYVPIPCWFKTGNMEYPNDSLPVEQKDANRNVALLFTPTQGPTKLKLRMHYNNSPHPRINVADRDRGTGAVSVTDEPVTTIDMDASLLPERISSGVCRALFTANTYDDFRGNDRHVAIEMSSDRGDAGPVVLHAIDVYGVV